MAEVKQHGEVAAESAAAIDAVAPQAVMPTEFLCGSGVVIQFTKFPRYLVYEAGREFDKNRPSPPIVRDEDKGREFENPEDPTFVRQAMVFNINRGEMIMNAYLAFGTKLLSKPKDLSGPDDDAWIDEIRDMGIMFSVGEKGKRSRYVQWLKAVAFIEDDYTTVTGILYGVMPTKEADVAAATESFPSNGSTPADTGSGDSKPVRPRRANRA